MDLFSSSKTKYTAFFASVALLLSLALGILALTCAALGGRNGMLPEGDGSATTDAGSGPVNGSGADTSGDNAPGSSSADSAAASSGADAGSSSAAPATNAPAGSAAGDGSAAETGDSIISAVIAVIVVIAIILVIIALMPRRGSKAN